MDGLFPIIRRKRRPLIEADPTRVVVGNAAPVQAVAAKPVEPAAAKAVTKASDAKPVGKLDA